MFLDICIRCYGNITEEIAKAATAQVAESPMGRPRAPFLRQTPASTRKLYPDLELDFHPPGTSSQGAEEKPVDTTSSSIGYQPVQTSSQQDENSSEITFFVPQHTQILCGISLYNVKKFALIAAQMAKFLLSMGENPSAVYTIPATEAWDSTSKYKRAKTLNYLSTAFHAILKHAAPGNEEAVWSEISSKMQNSFQSEAEPDLVTSNVIEGYLNASDKNHKRSILSTIVDQFTGLHLKSWIPGISTQFIFNSLWYQSSM